jgi:hypothetical protein
MAPDGLRVPGGAGVADVELLGQGDDPRQLRHVVLGDLLEHPRHVLAVDDRAVAAQLARHVDRARGRAHQHAELLAVLGVARHAERDRHRKGVD